MKIYYHATPAENITSIYQKGLLPSKDGLVYLADSVENALKFGFFSEAEEIAVFSVRVLKADAENVIETFDHNEEFFKCKAYGYLGKIDTKKIKLCYKWTRI